jgi:hypothetical protein
MYAKEQIFPFLLLLARTAAVLKSIQTSLNSDCEDALRNASLSDVKYEKELQL